MINETCKVRFKWYVDKETKKLTWRELTGPEKVRLFQNINIPTLFPSLEHKDELQTLWERLFLPDSTPRRKRVCCFRF